MKIVGNDGNGGSKKIKEYLGKWRFPKWKFPKGKQAGNRHFLVAFPIH